MNFLTVQALIEMLSVLDSGSSGLRSGPSPVQGHCGVFLGKTLYFFILIVPLSTQVYNLILAIFLVQEQN